MPILSSTEKRTPGVSISHASNHIYCVCVRVCVCVCARVRVCVNKRALACRDHSPLSRKSRSWFQVCGEHRSRETSECVQNVM